MRWPQTRREIAPFLSIVGEYGSRDEPPPRPPSPPHR
jgi:hypothetical protein